MAKLSKKERERGAVASLPGFVYYNARRLAFSSSRAAGFARWAQACSTRTLKRNIARPRNAKPLAQIAAARFLNTSVLTDGWDAFPLILVSKRTAMALAAMHELNVRGET